MNDGTLRWVQPPTRYNALGIIRWDAAGEEGWDVWDDRERVTLAQLETLASLPQTDAAAPVTGASSGRATFVALGFVSLLGAIGAMHISRRRPPMRRRPGTLPGAAAEVSNRPV